MFYYFEIFYFEQIKPDSKFKFNRLILNMILKQLHCIVSENSLDIHERRIKFYDWINSNGN